MNPVRTPKSRLMWPSLRVKVASRKKLTRIGIFKHAAEPHSLWDACYVFSTLFCWRSGASRDIMRCGQKIHKAVWHVSATVTQPHVLRRVVTPHELSTPNSAPVSCLIQCLNSHIGLGRVYSLFIFPNNKWTVNDSKIKAIKFRTTEKLGALTIVNSIV